MTTKIKFDRFVDNKTCRQYINGTLTVWHCHHYAALYSQLAMDAEETVLLKECARISIKDMLLQYIRNYTNTLSQRDKIDTCLQYYSLLGLGKMQLRFMGDDSGSVELVHSHIDSGWIKKWGKSDKPVNYITAGFIEAMFEVCMSDDVHSFYAEETQSIAMGAETSIFKATRSQQ